jgi:dihydroorotate dehydrogenase (NAD+) catalytic subunit
MSIDVEARRPRLGNGTGGLSGPAVKPLAVRMVYQVAEVVDLPLVGMGGITRLEDALEFFMAGASCVQVGTATFAQPGTMLSLVDELAAWMEREGVRALDELVGAAH